MTYVLKRGKIADSLTRPHPFGLVPPDCGGRIQPGLKCVNFRSLYSLNSGNNRHLDFCYLSSHANHQLCWKIEGEGMFTLW